VTDSQKGSDDGRGAEKVSGRLVDRLWRELGRQLRCPTGVAGSIVGQLMATLNERPNRLAIDALEVAFDDKILELGFGPGKSLEALVKRAPGGEVHGIDKSERMLKLAMRKNRAAIASGRMHLALGRFSPLPWCDAAFSKILLVNVVYFFDLEGRDISEVYRVLRPGGRVVVYATDRSIMAKWPFAGPETHRTFDATSLSGLLEGVGFARSGISIERVRLPFGIEGMVAVASKP
jgi:SAM-dependent methyltransferase